MKHKRIFSIILLFIFVLSNILSLYTAIADCEKGEEEIKGIIRSLQGQLVVAEARLQTIKDKGYLKTMTEKQREMIVTGAVGTATGAAIASLSTGGTLTVPLVIKGAVVGGLGGAIVGPIFGYFSHSAALSAAEKEIKLIKESLTLYHQELDECRKKEGARSISPQQTTLSIRYNPIHLVDINTSENFEEIYFYFLPVDPSQQAIYNHIIMNTPKSSTTIWYQFKDAKMKGVYNVQISVFMEGYNQKKGIDKKHIQTEYQINVND